MNAELEALILALDAVFEAGTGQKAQRLDAIYQSQIDNVLARYPSVSRERLVRAVDFAHAQWLQHQKKPVSLPPKA